MKAKNIISAVLLLILPFILILGFGALGRYLSQIADRTFDFIYVMLSFLTAVIPIVAYVFWLSFVMRTGNRSAKILLSCCSFAVSLALSIFFFTLSIHFLSVITVSFILANIFAAIYMLSKGIKGNKLTENN